MKEVQKAYFSKPLTMWVLLQISPLCLYLPFRWSVCLLASTLRKKCSWRFCSWSTWLMLQHLTWLADYFLKESQHKRERYKNVRLTNKAHTNTTAYRAYLLLNLSSEVLTNLLQHNLAWVIDLYNMLQRLIELKKYSKGIAVHLPSQMLKEYNTAAMFVLSPIRDTRFCQVQLKLIL